MKNYRYNRLNTIDCDIDHDIHGVIPATLTPEESQKVIDSGVEIAAYVEPVKTNDQLIAEIDDELTSLDATPRMLSGALMGDQWSIDKLKDLEDKQTALRGKRKALL